MWCRVRVQPHSFACGYPVFPAPCLEKLILSSVNGLCTLVKIHLTIYAKVYFRAFYAISLVYCVYLCQHCTVLFTLQYVLKSESVISLTLFLFFQIVLAIQGPLRVHMNLRIYFSIFAKNIIGLFSSLSKLVLKYFTVFDATVNKNVKFLNFFFRLLIINVQKNN